MDSRLLLGLQGPDSRFTAPASIQREAMLSVAALPPLIPSRWAAGLQLSSLSFHFGNLNHTASFNPCLCDDKS